MALVVLKKEMEKKKASEEKLQLMQATFDRVFGFAGLKELKMFDWFISPNDLHMKEKLSEQGSFGQIRQATLYHEGKQEEVVVKQVVAGVTRTDRGPFTKQLDAWFQLAEHPNILKLYGGCHIGSKPFYVCEKATQGNLASALKGKSTLAMFWEMFIQVAEGLQYLHKHGIVHGSLTCSNILVGEYNTVKLSDFGFSAARSLSMALSVSYYSARPQTNRWKLAGDEIGDQELTVASDISSLGQCMLEILHQDRPLDNQSEESRGDGSAVAKDVWNLINQLTTSEVHRQLSLHEAVKQFRRHLKALSTSNRPPSTSAMPSPATASGSFPIDKLRGSPSSRATLDGLKSRCKRMPENETLCQRVVERLEFLHDAVVPLDPSDKIKQNFVDMVVKMLKLMVRTPMLQRLAVNETILLNIKGFQEKLDDVQKALGKDSDPIMTAWKDNWEQDRQEQYQKLIERVPKASDRMLVNEIRGDRKLQETLMTLEIGTNWQSQPPELIQLKKDTLKRVCEYTHQNALEIFDWFIPSDNVEYEDEYIGLQGTFGDVSRGTWLNNGQRINVVVKRLFVEGDGDGDGPFLKQLQLWSSLPHSAHILKLYGGNHLSTPEFYVCEYAPHGNLSDFLDREPQFFWQMFEDAVRGLKVLHSNNAVHGGLKCNNILVGDNYTTKLTDFGFTSVRTLSAGHSADAAIASNKGIRWRSMEVLAETGTGESLYASDIYSMGMCMIEALTHEAPFGVDNEETVLEKILDGELPERPEEATDDMWNLITNMCNPDHEKRPSLDDVLLEMSAHAADERKLTPLPRDSPPHERVPIAPTRQQPAKPSKPQVEATTCFDCERNLLSGICGRCGFAAEKQLTIDQIQQQKENAHHGLSRFLKMHSEDEALDKLLEMAVVVHDLHDQDVIHGNLKPANIRIGRDGRAHLSGFRFCRRRVDRNIALSDRSFRWQAPECLAGEPPSCKSDVYSLGMCFIFCMCGEPPWGSALSDEDVKSLVLEQNTNLPKPKGLDRELWELVRQMCCHDPNQRVTSGAVVDELSRLFSGKGRTADPWIIEADALTFSKDVHSSTLFTSRHLGEWRAAPVFVDVVKARSDRSSDDFRRVRKLWFSLKHPTIHMLYGSCETDDQFIFVCERAEKALSEYTSATTPSDLLIWQVILDAAVGLQYIHSLGVAHGDVTLHNILVSNDGRGKLSGFFHADYTVNEQDRSDFDVLQLGRCILDSFGREEQSSTLRRHEEFSDAEWTLVSRMCSPNPSDRPDIVDVVHHLESLVAVSKELPKLIKQRPELTVIPNYRHKLQSWMLAEMAVYEREDKELQQMDEDDDEFWVERDKLSKQCSMDRYAEDASRAFEKLLKSSDSDLEGKLQQREDQLSADPFEDTSIEDWGVAKPPPFEWSISCENIAQDGSSDDMGEGSFAHVRRGVWLGSPVALKVLKETDRLEEYASKAQELHVEANIWFGIRHPYIATLYGARSRGYQLFVCDLLNKLSLDDCHGKNVSKQAIWEYLHDAAMGLQGLHSLGVVHADLKCNNILIGSDDRAKLIDFGLSCLRSYGGKALGAFQWKAPECLDSGPTFASDIYSFGICIFEAQSGTFPWKRTNELVVKTYVRAGRFPSQPDELQGAEWALVKKMCCRQPEERLGIDLVVKVLGMFARRSPFVEDSTVRQTIATWETEQLEEPVDQPKVPPAKQAKTTTIAARGTDFIADTRTSTAGA